jgi:hypothetical protein
MIVLAITGHNRGRSASDGDTDPQEDSMQFRPIVFAFAVTAAACADRTNEQGVAASTSTVVAPRGNSKIHISTAQGLEFELTLGPRTGPTTDVRATLETPSGTSTSWTGTVTSSTSTTSVGASVGVVNILLGEATPQAMGSLATSTLGTQISYQGTIDQQSIVPIGDVPQAVVDGALSLAGAVGGAKARQMAERTAGVLGVLNTCNGPPIISTCSGINLVAVSVDSGGFPVSLGSSEAVVDSNMHPIADLVVQLDYQHWTIDANFNSSVAAGSFAGTTDSNGIPAANWTDPSTELSVSTGVPLVDGFIGWTGYLVTDSLGNSCCSGTGCLGVPVTGIPS